MVAELKINLGIMETLALGFLEMQPFYYRNGFLVKRAENALRPRFEAVSDQLIADTLEELSHDPRVKGRTVTITCVGKIKDGNLKIEGIWESGLSFQGCVMGITERFKKRVSLCIL